MDRKENATTANTDFADRSPDIHWPAGFSPEDADLFAHNEIFINAPRAKVWQHLIEAEKWPEWYPNSHDVRIVNASNGLLQEGSRFEWTTFGIPIVSRVFEFVPTTRLGWFGDGIDINAYQTWFLADKANGCQVVMEEVAKGLAATSLRNLDPHAMHKGHDLWNSSLKMISEK